MKNILIYTLLTVVMFILNYTWISFILLETNILLWLGEARFFFVFFSLIFSFASCMIYKEAK